MFLGSDEGWSELDRCFECRMLTRNGCRLNLGLRRTVPPDTKPFYVHHIVKMREEAKNLPGGPYRPKATWGELQPIYVD